MQQLVCISRILEIFVLRKLRLEQRLGFGPLAHRVQRQNVTSALAAATGTKSGSLLVIRSSLATPAMTFSRARTADPDKIIAAVERAHQSVRFDLLAKPSYDTKSERCFIFVRFPVFENDETILSNDAYKNIIHGSNEKEFPRENRNEPWHASCDAFFDEGT